MEYEEEILNTREQSHGDYALTADISQRLKDVLTPHIQCTTAVQRESFSMICTKLSRIASGSPDEPDHWDDIAGYAKLVSERLK